MKFIGRVLATYKINFLISIAVAVILVASRVEKSTIGIIQIALGSLLAGPIFDLEYLIFAYWYNPTDGFSVGLKELVAQKNYAGVISYIQTQKFAIKDRMLCTVGFQLALGVLAVVFIMSSENLLGLSLAVCAYAQSLYTMFAEYLQKGDAQSWFWGIKNKPNQLGQKVYFLAAAFVLVAILYLV